MLMACVGNLADIFSVLFPLITEQQKWVPSYALLLMVLGMIVKYIHLNKDDMFAICVQSICFYRWHQKISTKYPMSKLPHKL